MDVLNDTLGLSLTEALLLLAVIFVVVDSLLQSDVPSHIAYILISMCVAINVETNILTRMLCGLLAWFAIVAFHYYVWRKFLKRFLDKHVAPDVFHSDEERLVGSTGVIEVIDGVRMLKVHGELRPCVGAETFGDGTLVHVLALEDGTPRVTTVKVK